MVKSNNGSAEKQYVEMKNINNNVIMAAINNGSVSNGSNESNRNG